MLKNQRTGTLKSSKIHANGPRYDPKGILGCPRCAQHATMHAPLGRFRDPLSQATEPKPSARKDPKSIQKHNKYRHGRLIFPPSPRCDKKETQDWNTISPRVPTHFSLELFVRPQKNSHHPENCRHHDCPISWREDDQKIDRNLA